MKKLDMILGAFLLAAIPAATLAQAGGFAQPNALWATMACRPTQTGEKPSATTVDQQSPIVCKKMDMASMQQVMGKMSSADQKTLSDNFTVPLIRSSN